MLIEYGYASQRELVGSKWIGFGSQVALGIAEALQGPIAFGGVHFAVSSVGQTAVVAVVWPIAIVPTNSYCHTGMSVRNSSFCSLAEWSD